MHNHRIGSGIRKSISAAFKQIFEKAGEPSALIYNAGYLEGRDLPPEKNFLNILMSKCLIPLSILPAVALS